MSVIQTLWLILYDFALVFMLTAALYILRLTMYKTVGSTTNIEKLISIIAFVLILSFAMYIVSQLWQYKGALI